MHNNFSRSLGVVLPKHSATTSTINTYRYGAPLPQAAVNSQTCRRTAPSSSPSNQRGVMGIVAALTLTSAILFMVLAVDSGRLYWEGQELQRLADLAALDAATANPNIFNGVTLVNEDSNPLQSAAEASATLNGADSLNVPLSGVVATQGAIELTDSIRSFAASGGSFNDAVRVRVTKDVCGSVIASLSTLIPNGGYDEPTSDCLTPGFPMTREAVARRTAYVAFSAGTSLLRLDASTSPLLKPLLTDMLGLDLGVSAVSYDSLASLYALPPVPLRTLLTSLALDLNQDGELIGASTTTLNGLVDELYGLLNNVNVPSALSAAEKLADSLVAPFDLQDILKIVPNNGQLSELLETKVNIGDLINAAAMASITNGVDLTGQVGPLRVMLDIGQPPVVAVGPAGCKGGIAPPCVSGWVTEAKPAQIGLSVKLIDSNLLGLLDANVEVNLSSVTGVAGIDSVTRNSTSPTNYALRVAGVPNLLDVTSSISIKLKNPLSGNGSGQQKDPLGLSCLISATADLKLNIGTNTSSPQHFGDDQIVQHPSPLIWPSSNNESVKATLASSDSSVIMDTLSDVHLGAFSVQLIHGKPQGLLCGLLDALGLTNLLNTATSQASSALLTTINNLLSIIGQPTIGNISALNTILASIESLLGELLAVLGVWINTIDVEILNVHAGAPQLVI